MWEQGKWRHWRFQRHLALQCKLLHLWIIVTILTLQSRNFEITLLSSYITAGGLAGSPSYLQIYLRIERSTATKVFVVVVAIMNCEFLEALTSDTRCVHNMLFALSRAHRHCICHNLRSDYGISKSRNIFRDVCSPSWRFVCFFVHQIQSARRPSWFRWDLSKFLKRCPQTKRH